MAELIIYLAITLFLNILMAEFSDIFSANTEGGILANRFKQNIHIKGAIDQTDAVRIGFYAKSRNKS